MIASWRRRTDVGRDTTDEFTGFVQATCARLFASWRRVRAADNAVGCALATLTNVHPSSPAAATRRRCEKMWCTGPGDLAVSIVWRAAAKYDGFVARHDSDGRQSTTPMLDGTGTVVAARGQVAVIVSEPGGRWFVSVQQGAGVDLELGHRIAEHLFWQ